MNGYSFESSPLNSYSGYKIKIYANGIPISFHDVVGFWLRNDDFIRQFSSVLSEMPFQAYFWELPPLTNDTVSKDFECVVIDSPGLARRRADPNPFHSHFTGGEKVLGFPSLGGDALLVIPETTKPRQFHCHLASYFRKASEQQISQLFRKTAEHLLARLGDKPIWLSTSGLGVSWLHIRLDERPKYYVFRPYVKYPAL